MRLTWISHLVVVYASSAPKRSFQQMDTQPQWLADLTTEYQEMCSEVPGWELINAHPRGRPRFATANRISYDLLLRPNLRLDLFLDTGGDISDPVQTHIGNLRFFLNQKSAKVGAATKMLAKSTPIPLPDYDSMLRPRYPFKLIRDFWSRVREKGSSIIGILSEKPGDCLSDIRERNGGALPLVQALEIGIEIIERLAALHKQAGVVHGYLVPAAICYISDSESLLVFKNFDAGHLIDRSGRMLPVSGFLPSVRSSPDHFASIGELRNMGSPPTPRDEVFRAFAIVLWLAHSEVQFAPSPSDPIDLWIEWTLGQRLRYVGDVLRPKLTGDGLRAIRSIHRDLVDALLSNVGGGFPDYGFYISQLERMIAILETETL